MMDMTEQFLQSSRLQDPEDFDALIELASLVRTLMAENRWADLGRIITYTLEQGCFEAFSWCMDLLQEALDRPDSGLEDFDCPLGRAIPNFDPLLEQLQVDLRACSNGLETVPDRYGEVESFFNILVYKTGYSHIFLVSSENFDTRDNDFIQYKLRFSRNDVR